MAGNEMMVDVDIPIDIEGAWDPDGLPKVVSKTPVNAPAPIKPEELEAVRRDLGAERAARLKAEQEAAAAAEAARTAAGQATDTKVQAYAVHYAKVSGDLQRISDAIASTEAIANGAEREMIAAEAALAAATDPAEREDLATRKVKAQRELARAEAELTTLNAGKYTAETSVEEAKRYWQGAAAHADAAKAAAAAEPPKTATQNPPEMTPEQWIDSCPAATRPWLREHKEFATPGKQQRAVRRFAEEYADDNGGVAALDSADFVAALNAKFFPKSNGHDVTDDETTVTEPARTRNAPAAPVSRTSSPGGGGSGAGGSSKVRLSADEQATAVAMYPEMERVDALKRYATNKARAIADGLYAPRQ